MKIERFEIRAFGPFTDKVLDFTSEVPGLHIVYGPNEAGKSSSLRALKAWLFGFPERTRDNFIHPNRQLLVGGELRQADGRNFKFFRRKKRVGSLIDADGNTLPETVLEPFLAGLDLAVFETLYGIDHDSLVRGGRDILARRGEVGQALFSAGAGLSSLGETLDELDRAAGELYKANASKPRINQRLSRYKQLKKEIRDLSLPPDTWNTHVQNLQEIEEALKNADARRKEQDRELHYLDRLQQALPLLTRWKNVKRQKEGLGKVRLLPAGFSERRSRVQQELRTTVQRLNQAEVRFKEIEQNMEAFAPGGELLDLADAVEESHQRLGEYRKALQDRPRIEGMQATNLKEAARLLTLVHPGHDLQKADTLLPLYQRKKTIVELVSRHKALLQARQDAEKRKASAARRLQEVVNRLSALPGPVDPAELKLAIKTAQKAGEIDTEIDRKERDKKLLGQECIQGMEELGLQCSIEDLPGGLKVPTPETVQRFADDFREIERKLKQLGQEKGQGERDQLRVRTELREIAYGGEVPTEEELFRLRKKRDLGWLLIRRAWLDQEDVAEEVHSWAPDQDLAGTFQSLVNQADVVGDRLRHEADRVHKFAGLKAGDEELTILLDNTCNKAADAATLKRKLSEQWESLWQPHGIAPRTPVEMSTWLAGFDKLRQQAGELQSLQQECDRLQGRREELISHLLQALKEMEVVVNEAKALEPVLSAAGAQLEKLLAATELARQLDREQEDRTEAAANAEDDLQRAEDELALWQRQWDEIVLLPGEKVPVPPIEASDLLETMGQLFVKLDRAKDDSSRMNGIDRDCLDFEREVRELAGQVAPDLTDLSALQCVQQMQRRLTKARKDQVLYTKYVKERQELFREMGASGEEKTGLQQELAELLTMAGCEHEEDFPAAEQAARAHARLTEQLEEVESDLQALAGDMDLSEFETQAAKMDMDALPGRIHELRGRIEQEIDPEIRRLIARKAEERKELAQMDGSAPAAEKAEEQERNLAGMRRQAERYVRLKLASSLLQREIDGFRARNQDPVLRIASKLFADLTLGSFSALSTDLDDRGEPILVGLRGEKDSALLDVEAMSTGTRDQLYLALRLATLKYRAESGHSMPFIVDDILINFDDARSKATLQILADLGRNTQVILFTHHHRVVEEAETIDSGAVVHVLMTT